MEKIIKTLSILLIAGSTLFGGFFLDNGIGLKGMQMGGAYTANPQGPDALFWNVANLANNSSNQAYVAYAQKFDDVKEYQLMFNMALDERSAIGVAYFYSGVDNITQWSTASQNMGTFSFINQALLAGYSLKFSEAENVGITAKFLGQRAIDQAGFFAMDLAYHRILFGDISFGLVLQDIYATGSDILPIVRAGLSKPFGEVTLAVDYIYSSIFQRGFYKLGVNYTGLKLVDLKAGYSDYDKLFYAGMSINFNGINLDYLYSNPDLGTVHQFGVGINF